MPISAIATVETSRQAAWFRRLLLYVLCGSLALYPLLEKFVAPVIAASYVLVAMVVVFRLFKNGFRVPSSYVGWVWLSYITVYGVWYAIAIFYDNRLAYISQDSLGFLLYFGFLPVLYLYIVFCGLQTTFFRFVVGCCVAISAVSVVAVAGYFLLFGEVDGNALLATNAFIATLGLNWQIDSNGGLLGMYTYTAHLLLLGMSIVLCRYAATGRRRELALATLFLVGIVLDGHRALVFAALLQLTILGRRLLRRLRPLQRLALIGTLTLGMLTTALVNWDWIQERFSFSGEDPSTAERYAQIPALMDKIERHPVLGTGFGSTAAYIRSIERPFSYEVDFLATVMKLGLVGSALYFGTYLLVLAHGWLAGGRMGFYLLSAGLAFFFYMGTNGNQAMSTDSAVFHIFIFLLIAFAIEAERHRQPHPRPPAP